MTSDQPVVIVVRLVLSLIKLWNVELLISYHAVEHSYRLVVPIIIYINVTIVYCTHTYQIIHHAVTRRQHRLGESIYFISQFLNMGIHSLHHVISFNNCLLKVTNSCLCFRQSNAISQL